MAKEHPCFDKVLEATAGLAKEDLRKILNELQQAKDEAAEQGFALREKLENIRDKGLSDLENQHHLSQFRYFRRLEKKAENLNTVMQFSDSPDGIFRGIKSRLTGTQFAKAGARQSEELVMRTLEGKIFNGYVNEINDAGLWHRINGVNFDEEVKLYDELIGKKTGDKEAAELSTIHNKYRDEATRMLEREGFFTEELDDHGVKHFHVHGKLIKWWDSKEHYLRNVASLSNTEKFERAFQKWKTVMQPLLDLKRTKNIEGIEFDNLSDEEQETSLREGFRVLTNRGTFTDVGKSMAERVGAPRRYHFKDSQSYVKYNREYGTGTIQESMKRELQSMSQNIGILQTWGDQPKRLIEDVAKSAMRLNPEFRFTFDQKGRMKKLMALQDQIQGTFNDSSSVIARIGANIRTFNNITLLGKVLFAAFTDMAPITIEAAKITGSYSQGFGVAIKNLMDPSSRALNLEVAKAVNLYAPNVMGSAERFSSAEDAPSNFMSKLKDLHWKLSLMRWWDDGHRAGIASLAARTLAVNKDTSFADMAATQAGRDTMTRMQQYGIDSKLWDLIRSSPVSDVKGTQLITQDVIQNVDDKTLQQFLMDRHNLKGPGRLSGKFAIQDLKDEVSSKLGMYFTDRVDHAILKPSAADKNFWFGETRAGTKMGQAARFFGQYKMYGTTFGSKPIASLLYGRGADTWQEALLQGKGDRVGLSILMGYATMLGYGSLVADSISNNETPPSPFSERGMLGAWKKGGAFGLYTDSMFTNPNGFKQDIATQLAGPTFGKAFETYDALGGMFYGSTSKSQMLRLIKSNTPLANLFWTKWLTDYLVFNRLQNAVSPNYFHHKLKQLQQQHQHFIIPPN